MRPVPVSLTGRPAATSILAMSTSPVRAANVSAEKPSVVTAWTSAWATSNIFAISDCPSLMAHIRGAILVLLVGGRGEARGPVRAGRVDDDALRDRPSNGLLVLPRQRTHQPCVGSRRSRRTSGQEQRNGQEAGPTSERMTHRQFSWQTA